MTLDQLNRRDARIAALEALGRCGRSLAEQDELGQLVANRDLYWRRLPRALARARDKAAGLEAYARQVGFVFPLAKDAA